MEDDTQDIVNSLIREANVLIASFRESQAEEQAQNNAVAAAAAGSGDVVVVAAADDVVVIDGETPVPQQVSTSRISVNAAPGADLDDSVVIIGDAPQLGSVFFTHTHTHKKLFKLPK